MIVHKGSGQRVRLCAACFDDGEVAAHGRNSQQTITGPASREAAPKRQRRETAPRSPRTCC